MSRYAFGLPGYERYSVWGWDDGMVTWFLQVRPNPADPDGPPMLWLDNWDRPLYPLYPLELARLAAPRLGVSVLDVLLAMEVGGRGSWHFDSYRSAPRLAEAIAYYRRLDAGKVLDAMLDEAGLDYHYFGGWEWDDEGRIIRTPEEI